MREGWLNTQTNREQILISSQLYISLDEKKSFHLKLILTLKHKFLTERLPKVNKYSSKIPLHCMIIY